MAGFILPTYQYIINIHVIDYVWYALQYYVNYFLENSWGRLRGFAEWEACGDIDPFMGTVIRFYFVQKFSFKKSLCKVIFVYIDLDISVLSKSISRIIIFVQIIFVLFPRTKIFLQRKSELRYLRYL